MSVSDRLSGWIGQPGHADDRDAGLALPVPAQVVGDAHRAGRVAGHGVDAAVGGAGPDRDDRRALGASRSSHSLVVIGWPVAGSLPNPHQYPSSLIASFGIEPSTTSTNGSSSPRSALKNHSRKSSAPPVGPHSKSISGQCTAIWGSPGSAPSAISSMLGWVAAVSATESPSQLRPGVDPQNMDQCFFRFDCCFRWHTAAFRDRG